MSGLGHEGSKSQSPRSTCQSDDNQRHRRGPRLTRQRKVRRSCDRGIGLRVQSMSLPVSPNSFRVGRWEAEALPLPLPLPEIAEGICRRAEVRRRERIEKGVEVEEESHKDEAPRLKTNLVTEKPTANSMDNTVTGLHNIKLNIESMSAPATSYPSPTLSPRRIKASDGFTSSSVTSHEAPVCSVSEQEVPASYKFGCRSLELCHVRNPCKFCSSIIRSQKGRLFNCGQTQSAGVRLHDSLFARSSMAFRSSSFPVKVHPLPLPPGPPVLSPSETYNAYKSHSESIMSTQWKKGKLIGRGTYGNVFVATNRETGALCAIKEVEYIPDDPQNDECVKQLEREIKLLQDLKHRNIVRYLGSETVNDHFCIYLEYVHPGSITKYINDFGGALEESIVRNFTRHILSGLAYLHSERIVHRDIKGANLLVDASGVVKLADFGLAKHLTGQAYHLSSKGSPYWMAPEVMMAVMQNKTNPDHAFAIDIWSLGCTVIEMLNGKPPWGELGGAMFKVLNKTPPIPDELSLECKDFLMSCFRRNPAERPTAVMLLLHPFINSNVPLNMEAITHTQLLGTPHSPEDASCRNRLIPVWSRRFNAPKSATLSSRANQLCYGDNLNSTGICHHSPPCILKDLPHLAIQNRSHSACSSSKGCPKYSQFRTANTCS